MRITEFLNSRYSDRPFAVVLGHPVGHSLSPQIHNLAARHHNLEVTYFAVDCPPDDWSLIPELFQLPQFRGANITIPLKKEIISLLDDIDKSAQQIGAVNTVVPEQETSSGEQRRLKGYNTDAYGFLKPLENMGIIKTVTILGSGGAFQAVRYALQSIGTKNVYFISRSHKNDCDDSLQKSIMTFHKLGYEDVEEAVRLSDMIVNTTPVGMYPDSDASPLPEHVIAYMNKKICYDIIYNPLETNLLKISKKYGATTIGGLDMFIHQAARAFDLWFSLPMPVEQVRSLIVETIPSGKITV